MLTTPDQSYHGMVYTEHYGPTAYLGRARSVFQRTMGAVLSPLSAFLLMQGIETVALRMERHVENARRVAQFLKEDPRVVSVSYAGFPDSPYYELVQKYLKGRACSLLTFAIRGGYDGGVRFYDALKLFKRLVNLGDAKSLACHPALHHAFPDVARRAAPGRHRPGNHSTECRHRTTLTIFSVTWTRRSRRPSAAEGWGHESATAPSCTGGSAVSGGRRGLEYG